MLLRDAGQVLDFFLAAFDVLGLINPVNQFIGKLFNSDDFFHDISPDVIASRGKLLPAGYSTLITQAYGKINSFQGLMPVPVSALIQAPEGDK